MRECRTLRKRQDTLQSYGFTCKYSECERESSTKDGTASLGNEDQKNALFGADDEDEVFGSDDDQGNEDPDNEQGTARQRTTAIDVSRTAIGAFEYSLEPLLVWLHPLQDSRSSLVIRYSNGECHDIGTRRHCSFQSFGTMFGWGPRTGFLSVLCRNVGRDLYSTLYLMLRTESACPNVFIEKHSGTVALLLTLVTHTSAVSW
jgi:hypothetical protein